MDNARKIESILEDMKRLFAGLEPEPTMVSQPTSLDIVPNLSIKTEAIPSFDLWRPKALQPLVTPIKPISDQHETFGIAKVLIPGFQTLNETKSSQPKVQRRNMVAW